MSDWMALGAAAAFVTMTWATVTHFRRQRTSKDTHFALAFAANEAILRRHLELTIDHLALALLFDPHVAKTLRAVGADPAPMRAKLIERLGPLVPPDGTVFEPTPHEDLVSVLAHALSRRRSAPPELLLSAIKLGPESMARSLLPEETTLSRAPSSSSRRSMLVDCDRASGMAYRGGRAFAGDTQIRLFDDSKTSVDHVTATLTKTFDLSDTCARYVVRRIVVLGSAAVGPWPREEAEKLATKARDDARAAGFPLRFEIGPAI